MATAIVLGGPAEPGTAEVLLRHSISAGTVQDNAKMENHRETMLVFVHRGGLVGGGSFRDALATVHLVITKSKPKRDLYRAFLPIAMTQILGDAGSTGT